MTKAATSSDFFSPISTAAQDRHLHPIQTKKPFGHVLWHFSTLNGAWDAFRIVDYIFSFPKYFLQLSPARKEFFDKVSNIFSKCGNALSLPRILTDIHILKNCSRNMREVYKIDLQDPERNRIIAHGKKHLVISSMNLGNDVAQAALFLNDVSIIKLGKAYPVAEGIYNVTSLVNDTIELVDESYKLHHYKSALAHTDNEKTSLHEKRTLSWLKIGKVLPSIVGSVLAIAAIFFAVLEIPVVAAISLGLSVAWLTMKLASTFYEKIIADKQAGRMVVV